MSDSERLIFNKPGNYDLKYDISIILFLYHILFIIFDKFATRSNLLKLLLQGTLDSRNMISLVFNLPIVYRQLISFAICVTFNQKF